MAGELILIFDDLCGPSVATLMWYVYKKQGHAQIDH